MTPMTTEISFSLASIGKTLFGNQTDEPWCL